MAASQCGIQVLATIQILTYSAPYQAGQIAIPTISYAISTSAGQGLHMLLWQRRAACPDSPLDSHMSCSQEVVVLHTPEYWMM